MSIIAKAIKEYQENLRQYLTEELANNGGSYLKWYEGLAPFREYIVHNYIRLKLGKELYWFKGKKNKYGDVIDHHIVSYLAPLEFERIGWSGKKCKPYEQISKVSQYVTGGGRFLHVALPNKGFVYPWLICNDKKLYEQFSMPAPQYRKHISELMDAGVEVLDLYPVFKAWVDEHGDNELLFSKDHHISPVGAKLIADTIADYLKKTTEGLEGSLIVSQDQYYYYDSSASANNLTKLYINYKEDENEKTVLWPQGENNSQITIFGDCNLQSYQNLGAGITANLVYDLQYPIKDRGRVLLFDDKRELDNKMNKNVLKEIKEAEVKIYVAFSSAGFVRTSQVKGRLGLASKLLKEHSLSNYKWACFTLE